MAEKPKRKILIIEDEALVARELKSRLIQMGWDVVGIHPWTAAHLALSKVRR